jgi:hypothetical protein
MTVVSFMCLFMQIAVLNYVIVKYDIYINPPSSTKKLSLIASLVVFVLLLFAFDLADYSLHAVAVAVQVGILHYVFQLGATARSLRSRKERVPTD